MWRALSAQWLATFFVGSVSFLLGVWVARQIGPAAFGGYAVALAAGAILAIFIDGGMRNVLMREGARAGTQLGHLSGQLPAMAFGHALWISLFALVCALLFMTDWMVIALATIACFFGVVIVQYCSAVLRGAGKFVEDARWLIGQRTFSAVLVVTVVLAGFQAPWHILAAWAAGSLLGVLALPGGLLLRPVFKPDPALYRVALPLLWIDLATAVYFRSDMLVLQGLGVAQEEIGQYAAAYRLIEAVILVTNPIALLLFRKLRLLALGDPQLDKRIVKAALLALVVGTVVAAVLSLLSDPVALLTYGDRYPGSAGLLAVLAWALVFVLPNAVLTQAALALDLDRAYAWAAGLAALCNLGMNFLCVETYGPIASAWATLLTEAVLTMILMVALIGRLRRNKA